METRAGIGMLVMFGALHSTAAAADDNLDRLADLMDGRFDSQCTCANGSASVGERFVDWRQRIDAPSLGDYVFYQQLNQGDELKLYRQRILVLTAGDAVGRVEQTAYKLIEAERFVDARAGDPVFAGLGPEVVTPVFEAGCEQLWSVTDRGFLGYVDPAQCRIVSSRTGKHRRIEARTSLDADGMSLVERGFDDEFNQLFGTPPGESLSLWRVDDTGIEAP